jgi:hypothetical protein
VSAALVKVDRSSKVLFCTSSIRIGETATQFSVSPRGDEFVSLVEKGERSPQKYRSAPRLPLQPSYSGEFI